MAMLGAVRAKNGIGASRKCRTSKATSEATPVPTDELFFRTPTSGVR